MTDRQHQQIGLKLQAAVGGHRPLMKSERPIAQVAKPSAAGRRGVGKTLRHIATKLAALRVDGTVRAQRLHIDGKGRLMAVPMIEGALFVAGQLHASGRNVNPVRRLRSGVGHPGPGDWRGSSSVTRTPFGAAQQLNRHRRAAKAAADNHDMRFCTHRCPPPVCCLMVALRAISWR